MTARAPGKAAGTTQKFHWELGKRNIVAGYLDAKLEMYVRCLSRDQAPGPFTHKDPMLNRQLYKGRSV